MLWNLLLRNIFNFLSTEKTILSCILQEENERLKKIMESGQLPIQESGVKLTENGNKLM